MLFNNIYIYIYILFIYIYINNNNMTTIDEPRENLGEQIDTLLKTSQHNATVVHNSKFLANRYIVSDEYKESLNNRVNVLKNEISSLEAKKKIN